MEGATEAMDRDKMTVFVELLLSDVTWYRYRYCLVVLFIL